jgi:hypothetical protein
MQEPEIGNGSDFPQQPAPWPAPPYPNAGRRSGLPMWAKILIGVGAGAMVMVVLMCSGLIWLGSMSPETRALAGSQLSKRNVETIRGLGLLDEGERIKYFYSDGMLSIEEGMYFFTEDKIVLYSKGREPAMTVVDYGEVADITPEFSDSWLVDGTIWIELTDGTPLVMPISAEAGVDQLFYDALVQTWQRQRDQRGSGVFQAGVETD